MRYIYCVHITAHIYIHMHVYIYVMYIKISVYVFFFSFNKLIRDFVIINIFQIERQGEAGKQGLAEGGRLPSRGKEVFLVHTVA